MTKQSTAEDSNAHQYSYNLMGLYDPSTQQKPLHSKSSLVKRLHESKSLTTIERKLDPWEYLLYLIEHVDDVAKNRNKNDPLIAYLRDQNQAIAGLSPQDKNKHCLRIKHDKSAFAEYEKHLKASQKTSPLPSDMQPLSTHSINIKALKDVNRMLNQIKISPSGKTMRELAAIDLKQKPNQFQFESVEQLKEFYRKHIFSQISNKQQQDFLVEQFFLHFHQSGVNAFATQVLSYTDAENTALAGAGNIDSSIILMPKNNGVAIHERADATRWQIHNEAFHDTERPLATAISITDFTANPSTATKDSLVLNIKPKYLNATINQAKTHLEYHLNELHVLNSMAVKLINSLKQTDPKAKTQIHSMASSKKPLLDKLLQLLDHTAKSKPMDTFQLNLIADTYFAVCKIDEQKNHKNLPKKYKLFINDLLQAFDRIKKIEPVDVSKLNLISNTYFATCRMAEQKSNTNFHKEYQLIVTDLLQSFESILKNKPINLIELNEMANIYFTARKIYEENASKIALKKYEHFLDELLQSIDRVRKRNPIDIAKLNAIADIYVATSLIREQKGTDNVYIQVTNTLSLINDKENKSNIIRFREHSTHFFQKQSRTGKLVDKLRDFLNQKAKQLKQIIEPTNDAAKLSTSENKPSKPSSSTFSRTPSR